MAASAPNALALIIVLAVFVFFLMVQVHVASAADEVCNGVDDDGDGLCFGGSNDKNICFVNDDCPGGYCQTIDEDFTYQGLATGDGCDGIGECGGGVVECLNETTATCSTNPGGSDENSSEGPKPEICDGKDND
ncbi:MAG: hypothetical protein J7K54_03900, partial [Candidatus Aenigmarchaeota archaeon]|nr:hypothetical protein [Candidatus Aenigmarchaeota archaeon]